MEADYPFNRVLIPRLSTDEWQTQNRYMQVEAFDQIDHAQADPILSITTEAA